MPLGSGWRRAGFRLPTTSLSFVGVTGDFYAKFQEFRSVRSTNCGCESARETVAHVLIDCGRWDRERVAYKVSRDGMRALVSEQSFGCFQHIAEAVLRRKK
jgi:hypothetical protein